MEKIFNRYLKQLRRNGLINDDPALLGLADAEIDWSHPDDPVCETLLPLFAHLNINTLIFAKPAEPYWTMIDYLAQQALGPVTPRDCETRTFLHDLPVVETLTPEALIPVLQHRKSAIVRNHGIISCGTVSMEQPFVTFSSVCFACFVKFFSDFLSLSKSGSLNPEKQKIFESAAAMLPESCPIHPLPLAPGPFLNEKDVCDAICAAGKQVVDLGLVDSSFGNISYCSNHILYISQTGSFLDHLAGFIDPVPLDGSSCAGITASSELSAHLAIFQQTGGRAILHGHPKFSVILSMDCDIECCEYRGNCHRYCPCPRDVCGIPIVAGEVGTGPYGLCRTVPGALKKQAGVIVYGHGVFTTGDLDFTPALDKLIDIERQCRIEYFQRIQTAL